MEESIRQYYNNWFNNMIIYGAIPFMIVAMFISYLGNSLLPLDKTRIVDSVVENAYLPEVAQSITFTLIPLDNSNDTLKVYFLAEPKISEPVFNSLEKGDTITTELTNTYLGKTNMISFSSKHHQIKREQILPGLIEGQKVWIIMLIVMMIVYPIQLFFWRKYIQHPPQVVV
jgi:hypothetical protein